MYGFAHHKSTTVNVASAASVSTAVFIGEMNKIGIEVPAFNSLFGAATVGLSVKVAQDSADTFRTLKVMGNSFVTDWAIPATSGNYNAICPVEGYNWMQVAFTSAATDGYDVLIHNMK